MVAKSLGDAGLARFITASTGPSTPDPVDHVLAGERETGPAVQVGQIALAAGDEVVDGHHFVASIQQGPAEVGAEEPGAPGNHDPAHNRPMPS